MENTERKAEYEKAKAAELEVFELAEALDSWAVAWYNWKHPIMGAALEGRLVDARKVISLGYRKS